MPNCGVLNRLSPIAAKRKESKINVWLSKNPFCKKALLWEKVCCGKIHQIRSRNELDMRDINGHSYLLIGISSNPFTKEERITNDLVFYILWMTKHSKTSEVVIFDLPQIKNYAGVRNIDEHEAKKYAKRLGEQKKDAVGTITKVFGLDIPVRIFEIIEEDGQFKEICSQLEELRKKDPYIDDAFLSLVPNSIRQKIETWQLIRLFGWDDISKIPLPEEKKKEYLESQNKLRDYLLPYFGKEYIKGKAEEERERIIAYLHMDFEKRVREVSDYALQEVALILMIDGVKIGHQNEKGYDELAIYISKTYGIGNVTEDSFRYLPPSPATKDAKNEPIEPYDVRDPTKRLLITDSATDTLKKIRQILFRKNKKYVEFMKRVLIEMGADPRKVRDPAMIWALIYDYMTNPIKKTKLIIDLIEGGEEAYSCSMLSNILRFKDKNVLEIGCGRGELTFQIAKEAKSITALTTSKKELDEAIKKLDSFPESERSKITFRLLDGNLMTGDGLPFQDGSFDIALFSHLTHQTKNIEALLSETHRVVKTGGELVFLEPDFNFDYHGSDVEEIVSFMKGKVTTMRDWKQKIDFLTKEGALMIKDESITCGYHSFHSENALIQYLGSGKTFFYNLNLKPAEEAKIREAASKLPKEDGFIRLTGRLDCCRVIVAIKELPPKDQDQNATTV